MERGWRELAAEQGGIVARRQLLDLGWTPAQARQRVTTGRWVRVLPGIYATFTGAPEQRSRIWAAVLHAGTGAAATHETSLWLAAALDRPPALVQIAVDTARKVRVPAWVDLRRRSRLSEVLHPAASPPRTRLEEAVLDCCDATRSPDAALGLIFKATQRRLTTSTRLRAALEARPRHRWRALLMEVLAEVDAGVASPLERRYARDVEFRHRLPRGERNRPERAPGGGTWYRDVRYREYGTVVELDGLEAHPVDQRFRDLDRDNRAAVVGETVLRYGWHDVAVRPCQAAGQVGTVLRTNGWFAVPRPCSPRCRVPDLGKSGRA